MIVQKCKFWFDKLATSKPKYYTRLATYPNHNEGELINYWCKGLELKSIEYIWRKEATNTSFVSKGTFYLTFSDWVLHQRILTWIECWKMLG